MDRKIILGILAFSVVAIGVGLRMPGKQPAGPAQDLPWQVKVMPDGGTRVFGVELGRSTLGEAEMRIGDQAKVALFAAPAGDYAAEAYYDGVNLSGLHAKLVLSLAVPQAELAEMFGRGLRISTAESGARKVDLAPQDEGSLRWAVISMITYIPSTDVSEDLLRKRFGAPAQRVRETGGAVVHLLYPALGLDVALPAEGKRVFQYLPPGKFAEAMAPLLSAGEVMQ